MFYRKYPFKFIYWPICTIHLSFLLTRSIRQCLHSKSRVNRAEQWSFNQSGRLWRLCVGLWAQHSINTALHWQNTAKVWLVSAERPGKNPMSYETRNGKIQDSRRSLCVGHVVHPVLNLCQTTQKKHGSFPNLALIFMYITVNLGWNTWVRQKQTFRKLELGTIIEDQTEKGTESWC